MQAEPLFTRPGEKVCRACITSKPLDAFHGDKRRADGRKARCAACSNARRRDDYARAPDPVKERNRASYAKHAEARRAYALDRLDLKREEINARRRAAYPEQREVRLAQGQKWRDANREKVRAKDRRYRERRRTL